MSINSIAVNTMSANFRPNAAQFQRQLKQNSIVSPAFRLDSANLENNVDSRFRMDVSRSEVPTGYHPLWPRNPTLMLSDVLAIESGAAPIPKGLLVLCWTDERPMPQGIRRIIIRHDFTDEEIEFLRYFQSRIETIAQLDPGERDALIRNRDNLTKDEKFDAILAKYAGEPITEIQFLEMLIKLEKLGAICTDSFRILQIATGTGFSAERFRLAYERGFLPWTFDAECGCEYECECEYVVDLDELFLKELDRHHEELERLREIRDDSENENNNSADNISTHPLFNDVKALLQMAKMRLLN